MSRETESVDKNGNTISVKTSTEPVATPNPAWGALETSHVNENGQNSIKMGYAFGGSGGLFLNFSFKFELGVQIKEKKKND